MAAALKEQYALLGKLKAIDAGCQAVCFVLMMMLVFVDTGALGIGMITMAGIQIFSAFFWLVTLYKIPGRMPAAILIRVVFIIVTSLLALIFWTCSTETITTTLYTMIVVGPVCGFSYFFITIAEARYYKKLARNRS